MAADADASAPGAEAGSCVDENMHGDDSVRAACAGFAPSASLAKQMVSRAKAKLEQYELVSEGDARELGVPALSLESLQRGLSILHLKQRTRRLREGKRLGALTHAGLAGHGAELWSTAVSAGWSPYLLARAVVDEACACKGDRRAITSIMRDPSRIADSALSRAVADVVARDPFVSPAVDRLKASMGEAFERHLENILRASKLPFMSEDALRSLGAAKTPDVLLPLPLGVEHPVTGEAMVVHWIDSKALFGDATTHHESVLPQTQAYVNRYGPGIVVYWFGCEAALLAPPQAGGQAGTTACPCFPRTFVLPASTTLRHFAQPDFPKQLLETSRPPAA